MTYKTLSISFTCPISSLTSLTYFYLLALSHPCRCSSHSLNASDICSYSSFCVDNGHLKAPSFTFFRFLVQWQLLREAYPGPLFKTKGIPSLSAFSMPSFCFIFIFHHLTNHTLDLFILLTVYPPFGTANTMETGIWNRVYFVLFLVNPSTYNSACH